MFEAPYTWRKVRIKKQRKAGGFNYDILDELLGRKERAKQTGNFVSAAEPLSGLTMASGFAGLKSQPEVSAGYSRRMDSQWGVGVVALTWPFNSMKEQ